MLGVAVVIVAADLVTKTLVLRDLPGRPPVRLADGLLTLKLTVNPGAAFGVGTSYTAIIALIACGVVAHVLRMAARLRSLAWTIGLGLLLGGAAGNLGDRLFRAPGPLRGSVVDWLNLPHFPWTFNLADASITCAAVLIGLLAASGVRIDGAPITNSTPGPGTTISTSEASPKPSNCPVETTRSPLAGQQRGPERPQLRHRRNTEQLHGPLELPGQDV
jgi:signal peptidase II